MILVRDQPEVLICTPMCTAFSAWQNLTRMKRDPVEVERQLRRASMHPKFAMDMCKHQAQHKRYFLFEHPIQASSRSERCVKEVLEMPGVGKVSADQCQHGAEDVNGSPIRKPTYFMSASDEMRCSLQRVAVAGRDCVRGQTVDSMRYVQASRREELQCSAFVFVEQSLEASGISWQKIASWSVVWWACRKSLNPRLTRSC